MIEIRPAQKMKARKNRFTALWHKVCRTCCLKKLCQVAGKLVVLVIFPVILSAHAMPPPQPLLINSLSISPEKMLVVRTGAGFYGNRNDGADWFPMPQSPYAPWKRVGDGIGKTIATKLLPSSMDLMGLSRWWIPSFGENVAVGEKDTFYTCSGDMIYRSTDRGMTWVAVWIVPRSSGAALPVYCKMVLAAGGVLYAVSSQGLYQSTDSGVSWVVAAKSQVVQGGSTDRLFADTTGTLYANVSSSKFADDSRRVYKSRDGGIHWVRVNFGAGGAKLASRQAFKEKYIPQIVAVVNNTLYASSYAGLISSTDQGEHWVATGKGLKKQSAEDIVPWDVVTDVQVDTAGVLYATTPRMIYKRIVNSDEWQPLGRNGIPEFP